MKISIVAAVAQNGVIGKEGSLPWKKIPGDLPRFKSITRDHHVLMGRKTYESLGKNLSERTNIIISSDQNLEISGAFVFNQPDDAIKFAQDRGEQELMVIGGGIIYKLFMPQADKIYLTEVLRDCEGDTRFPEINQNEWNKTIIEENRETDPPYRYGTLERK